MFSSPVTEIFQAIFRNIEKLSIDIYLSSLAAVAQPHGLHF
jgi:hypothetical protein